MDAAGHGRRGSQRDRHFSLLDILLHKLINTESAKDHRPQLLTTRYLRPILRLLGGRAVPLPDQIWGYFYSEATTLVLDHITLHPECDPYPVRFSASNSMVDNVCILCNSVHY